MLYTNKSLNINPVSINTTIVLINLGTPRAPTLTAIRDYLKQFLSDKRIIQSPRLIWWCILNGIVLPFRSYRSTERYKSIWTSIGSPILINTKRQACLLQKLLYKKGHNVHVTYAMRYGFPSIHSVLNRLKFERCLRLLIFPAYPQYSSTTTASIFDIVFQYFLKENNIPELRFIKNYFDHKSYIFSLQYTVLQHWKIYGRAEKLIISFHGIPYKIHLSGDPYYYECHKTADLLAQKLALNKHEYIVSFQSKFGITQWLQPYTKSVLRQLALQGIHNVDVICPGFISDCLETLEEIQQDVKKDFLLHGGKNLHLIKCLNDTIVWGYGMVKIVEQHMLGWPTMN